MSDDGLKDYLLAQFANGRLSRRAFLGGMAAAGVSAAMLEGVLARKAFAAEPKRGGKLIIGTEGAASNDSLDPWVYSSLSNITMGSAVYDALLNRDLNLKPIPWLATSWEPNKDASAWVFNLREGVTFHDGSDFSADDAIYSLHRTYREGSRSPAKPYMSQITGIDKLGDHQIRINLAASNAEFPLLLTGNRLHMTKKDFEDFSSKPPGTGPFKVVEFIPGVRYVFARNENYWRDGEPYVDELEYVAVPDNTARINALLAGDVNALLQLDQKAVDVIAQGGIAQVLAAKSAATLNLAMMMDRKPTDNLDLRLALKYACDRTGIRDNVLKGHGMIGNDHPLAPIDPYYNSDIPQRAYDLDKARFHIKKAGLENTPIEIYGSDMAGAGALASIQHLQQSAAPAGINISIINPPSDSYWSAIWKVKPISVSGWTPAPSPDVLFSQQFSSAGRHNETAFKSEKFDKMLGEARSSLDLSKRKEIYGEMQLMLHEDGGYGNLCFHDYLDAARVEVQGIVPHPAGPFGNFQGHRTAWIDS